MTDEAKPKKTWEQREEEKDAREAEDRADFKRRAEEARVHNAKSLANNTAWVEIVAKESAVRIPAMQREAAALERIADALEKLTKP